MARSTSRTSKGFFLDWVDKLTAFGLKVGGLLFVISSAYLIYGILSGSVMQTYANPADIIRRANNVHFICQMLMYSGVALIFSGAIRFYNEEVVGYVLLLFGAAMYWGVPYMVSSSLAEYRNPNFQLPILIVGQYLILGIVALWVSPPFILADIWLKATGSRQIIAKDRHAVQKTKRSALIPINCWQTPHCREYMQKFCRAYAQKKPCWRIKSGCYCDEDMILRSLQVTNKGSKALDPKFTNVFGKTKELTPEQKRKRCRKCFMYREHQKQKYRIFSPLVFPLGIALIYMYQKPIRAVLGNAVGSVDRLAQQFSFMPSAKDAGVRQLVSASSANSTVEWVFMICVGLILLSYLLRLLEYLLFDLQV